MEHIVQYAGFFAAAFLSAAVLPFQSEVVLFGLLLTEHYQWWLVILVASIGNTLGSVVNWSIGCVVTRFEDRTWFPIKRDSIARVEAWYHHYGRWSLLLSWLPLIGDPLTIVAGVLREPFTVFLALVALAKTARYFAVAAVTFGWF